MTWQYLDGAGTQFSFEEEQFSDMLNQGLIGPETQVWTEGMTEWLPAAQVWPDAFPASNAAPKVKAAKRRKPATEAAETSARSAPAAAETADPKNQKPPLWVIAPAIACGALAVVLGFGLIPSAFGFGAAGLCIGISKLKWGLAARVWATIGVTVAAWVICIPLVFLISGEANKMFAAHQEKQEQIEREAKNREREAMREQERKEREARQAEERKLAEARKKMSDDVNFFREGLDEFKPTPPGSPSTPNPDPSPTPPPEPAPEPDKPERSREVPVGFAASEFAGGEGGSEFYDHHTGLAPMLGLECRFKTWTDQQAPCNLRTLYSRDEKPERDDLVHFLAEPGFAVGGMETEGQDHIYAIRLTFMAINDDGTLNPNDSYQSDWIGEPRDEEPYFTRFLGQGAPVLGLAGRGGMVTDAVGILYAETAATSFSVVRPDPTTVSVPAPQPKPDDPAAAERMR
ncbi:MAG: GYF domain-containing protein, partial [Verrucomicrobiota bacterium]